MIKILTCVPWFENHISSLSSQNESPMVRNDQKPKTIINQILRWLIKGGEL